jgi:hypothetical protein
VVVVVVVIVILSPSKHHSVMRRRGVVSNSIHSALLPYDSRNTQQLFPHTTLTG